MTAAAGAAGMAPLDMAAGGPSAVAPAGPRPQPQAQSNVVAKKADVNMGVRGQGYGTGPIATPAATYWRAKEQIAFRIQIPEAMKLYKAENGNAPRSHQEFMDKIIRPNQVQLPELPAGQQYVYDPQAEELMVVGQQQ
jgi:hypothetical protein